MGDEQVMSHWPTWPLPQAKGARGEARSGGAGAVQVTGRHACNYLWNRHSTFRLFESEKVSGEEYQRLMDAGFRRSGTMIYQPMCGGCRECLPIRVPVKGFVPSRSQRRVVKENG